MGYKIVNLGCRLNVAESTKIEQELIEWGLKPGKPVEVVVVNSCSITQKADKESGQLVRSLRRQYPKALVVVTGCFVIKENQWLDKQVVWVKNAHKEKVVNIIAEKLKLKKPEKSPEERINSVYERSGRRFVKIQDGCNKYCHYCVVPQRRGLSVSRPIKEIVEEVKRAEREGIKEVILTGVDIADFRLSKSKFKGDKLAWTKVNQTKGLTKLIEEILRGTKEIRIRLGSINYAAFDDEFVKLWQTEPRNSEGLRRLCRHWHLSLQSGNNETLKRMNRRHTIDEFMELVGKLREKIPGISITTDVIVGYPGETKEEFLEGFKNLQKIGFAKIHVFRYSLRPQTVAQLKGKEWGLVSEIEKRLRSKKVRELSKWGERWFREQMRGKELEVLVEKKEAGRIVGWSDNYVRVKAVCGAKMGELVKVKLDK